MDRCCKRCERTRGSALARCGASARARLMCRVLKRERHPHKCGRCSLRSPGDRSPQTEERSPGYEGKSVSDRIFSPSECSLNKTDSKNKVYGQRTTSRSAGHAMTMRSYSPVAPVTNAAAARCLAPSAPEAC